jgi:hypothetical protein
MNITIFFNGFLSNARENIAHYMSGEQHEDSPDSWAGKGIN